jgi:hypothetical protein
MINAAKHPIRQLLQANVFLARAHYHYRLHREGLQYAGPPVLVYQMGKVGSKTVRKSLRASNLDMLVYHVHFLTPDRVQKIEKDRRKYLGTEKVGLLEHVWLYQYLGKQIARGLSGKKWKVVTLTREPVARNISTFFENLDVEPLDAGQKYRIQSDYYDFGIVLDMADLDELIHFFFTKLYHDRPLLFFDEEIKGVFGIDVFSSAFPIARGYNIYEGEQADVLLIRLEDLNDCATEAFKEFLNIEGFTLLDTNIGSQKVYAPIYKKFKDAIVLPESYLERMYTSKYARHFYSEQEIARFRARWSSPGN